jgi:hypothetical protein
MLQFLGMVAEARRLAGPAPRRETLMEDATAEPRKRDWLFPVILGVLLAGSAISFALAFVERIAPPHQELKLPNDHARASPATDKVR